ncbi:metallophosphoesterase [Peredibacter sp. HCB2-198]|uniref:metallophosphoesterase n=1 Tax=Peredibacter sp. HCB2-198 TaxID=3383025 RepID=UPI0038B56236
MKIFSSLMLILLASCTENYTITQTNVPKKFKLCFIGDTGTGNLIQQAVAKRLSQEQCNSIHFLGDLIYPAGIKTDHDTKIETKFLSFYAPLGQRLYLTMGNHDYRGSIEAWLSLSRKNQQVIYPHHYYLLKINDICMVHFDTNVIRIFAEAPTAFKQTLWLEAIKFELRDCHKTFALTHYPYKSRGKHHGPATGFMKLYLWSMILGSFDYLISGHEHILSDEGVEDGTRLLISGGGGDPEKGESPGFLVFEIEFDQKKTKSISYFFRTVHNNTGN